MVRHIPHIFTESLGKNFWLFIYMMISENLDSFKGLNEEYPSTLLKLKNHLRNYFVKYNLSEQSIERLTFLCFEINV
jgi:hypothetical protein